MPLRLFIDLLTGNPALVNVTGDFGGGGTPPADLVDNLLTQDGSYILTQDGSYLLIQG